MRSLVRTDPVARPPRSRLIRLAVAGLVLALAAATVIAGRPVRGAEPKILLTPDEKAWLAEHKVVRVMVGTWPPFHFLDEDGQAQGLSLDYARQVLGELGLEMKTVPILWHDAFDSIQRFEKVDLLPSIARTPEREKVVNITQDYVSFPRVIFTRRDADFVGSLRDLYGKTVAVEQAFITQSLLERDHPEITLELAETTRNALEAVSLDQADAYVGNLAAGVFLIQRHGFVNLKVAAPTEFRVGNQAMGVRKDWPELASMIDKVLAKMTDAEHVALRKAALQVRFEYGIDVTEVLAWGGGVAGVLGFVIVVIVVWARRLGREIGERKQAEAALAEKTRELETFSAKLAKYLSPQIYEGIFSGERDTAIATERKKLTVCFADIQDFTKTTEHMEPEDLTALLNDFLTKMTDIALEHGATIDKYVGDAILVFFGDPTSRGVKEDALACVRMALAMQRRMADLRAKWLDMGTERPLHMRVGINTGFCNVGNFGSDQRVDYTIIGGEVNLAARLQSIAEPDGIVLAHETYVLVRDHIEAREMDPIRVKGISQAVRPYAIEGIFEDWDASERYIRQEREGMRLWVDLMRMSAGQRSATADALEDAARRLRAGEVPRERGQSNPHDGIQQTPRPRQLKS
ncbi:MAG: transporter substrate-binding domain-containing protein [Alphaproteobacteria bacterium]|nr:transporter substrate-binding domain-containing protein [Alphaproteobacteria bacterium]